MTRSRWRTRAEAVIGPALDGLPPGLTAAQLEDALRPLYPFGARRNHPYRQWRKAVLEAVTARIALSPPPAVTLGPAGVRCAPCDAGAAARCLACLPARDRWFALPEALRLEWRALAAAAARGDAAAAAAARDWADENMDLPPAPARGRKSIQ